MLVPFNGYLLLTFVFMGLREKNLGVFEPLGMRDMNWN